MTHQPGVYVPLMALFLVGQKFRSRQIVDPGKRNSLSEN